MTEGVNMRVYNENLVNTSQRRSMSCSFHVKSCVYCLCVISLDDILNFQQFST